MLGWKPFLRPLFASLRTASNSTERAEGGAGLRGGHVKENRMTVCHQPNGDARSPARALHHCHRDEGLQRRGTYLSDQGPARGSGGGWDGHRGQGQPARDTGVPLSLSFLVRELCFPTSVQGHPTQLTTARLPLTCWNQSPRVQKSHCQASPELCSSAEREKG